MWLVYVAPAENNIKMQLSFHSEHIYIETILQNLIFNS